jgi:hypothetical protein
MSGGVIQNQNETQRTQRVIGHLIAYEKSISVIFLGS